MANKYYKKLKYGAAVILAVNLVKKNKIPVTQLKGPKGNGDIQAAKLD